MSVRLPSDTPLPFVRSVFYVVMENLSGTVQC